MFRTYDIGPTLEPAEAGGVMDCSVPFVTVTSLASKPVTNSLKVTVWLKAAAFTIVGPDPKETVGGVTSTA
jgi:hypothetical protein